jgi:cytochrome c peroxidase
MHDGAFLRLGETIRYHLDPARGAIGYTTSELAADLRGPMGPLAPVLVRLDPALRTPVALSEEHIADLGSFVGEGLLDRAARSARLRHRVPEVVPSGSGGLTFELR